MRSPALKTRSRHRGVANQVYQHAVQGNYAARVVIFLMLEVVDAAVLEHQPAPLPVLVGSACWLHGRTVRSAVVEWGWGGGATHATVVAVVYIASGSRLTEAQVSHNDIASMRPFSAEDTKKWVVKASKKAIREHNSNV